MLCESMAAMAPGLSVPRHSEIIMFFEDISCTGYSTGCMLGKAKSIERWSLATFCPHKVDVLYSMTEYDTIHEPDM